MRLKDLNQCWPDPEAIVKSVVLENLKGFMMMSVKTDFTTATYVCTVPQFIAVTCLEQAL